MLGRRKRLVNEIKTQKRVPVKRWIVLGLVLLGIYAAFIGPSILKPLSPTVVLPPEPIGISIAGFQITNTILATLIADIILVLIAFSYSRFASRGNLVPSGFPNVFETLVEFLWNSVQGIAGNKWARRVFPVVATIFLIIFTANMIKLVPGFESIGYLKERAEGTGYAAVKLGPVYTLDKGQPVEAQAEGSSPAAEGTSPCKSCELVPFLRGSATDLNFPLALAVIAVVMTQVYGFWSLGPAYLEKFFQFGQLIRGGIFGMINFAVGLLELLLEFAKILSFTFRLFGNIFAGALLLSIVGALTAVVIPAGLYLFEIFFGVIQAYVFFLLATVFISGALVGHSEEHG
jgi:F-type H+-transporting ATPase subunit a